MKKKWEREELIALVRDHPVKMFFICPLGIGIDDIRWNELWLGIAQLAESIGCLVLVVLLLI